MKSNNLTLCLLGKSRAGDFYKVKKDNKEYVVTKEKLIRAIRETPSKNRNCTVRKGNIVMKPGFGEMKLLEVGGATLNRKKPKIRVANPKISAIGQKNVGNQANNEEKALQIVTRMEHKNTDHSVYMVDSYFSNYIAHRFEFLKKNFRILKKIDRITKIYQSTDIEVRTPFGLTSIENISSGCKCALCAKYLLDMGLDSGMTLNTDEAGDTPFLEICKLVVGSELRIYTSVYRNGFALEEARIPVLINGEPMDDPMDLIDKVEIIEGE